MRFAVLIFIAVPLLEMMLLFEVADVIGGLYTLGMVVLTAVIGVQILKRQGFSTLARAQDRLRSGQLPAQEIIEGMLLAGAGALLLTPGFITDTVGFVLLTGPLRRPIARNIIRSGVVRTFSGGGGNQGFSYSSYGSTARPGSADGDVYEGEYSDASSERLSDQDPGPDPDNKSN